MLFVVLDNHIISVGALEQGYKECFSIIHCEEPINNLSPKRLSRYKYHIKYLHKEWFTKKSCVEQGLYYSRVDILCMNTWAKKVTVENAGEIKAKWLHDFNPSTLGGWGIRIIWA